MEFKVSKEFSDAIGAVFQVSRDEAEEITKIDGVENATLTCEMCPFQMEGTLDGLPFYFRERWDRWSLSVGEDPVMIRRDGTNGFYVEGIFSGDHSADFKKAVEAWRETKNK